MCLYCRVVAVDCGGGRIGVKGGGREVGSTRTGFLASIDAGQVGWRD